MTTAGYIPSRPVLTLRPVGSRNRMAFPQSAIFSYARHALVAYLDYLSSTLPRPIKRILLPDYMCHEVSATLRGAGYEVQHYALEYPFDVSIADLEIKFRDPARWDVVVVGHFHGRICRNRDRVIAQCAERAIVVIEDAVHLPYPYAVKSPTRSHAVLYTFRKVYAVPHGAVLTVRDGDEDFARYVRATKPRRRGALIDVWQWIGKQAIKRGLMSAEIVHRRPYRDLSQSPLPQYRLGSRLVTLMLAAEDCYTAIEARRRNYRLYLDHSAVLKEWGDVLEYDLSRDVPEALLIALKDGIDRIETLHYLMQHGVPAGIGLAVEPSTEARLSSEHLYNRLITLPVHQDISALHICYILEVLTRKGPMSTPIKHALLQRMLHRSA